MGTMNIYASKGGSTDFLFAHGLECQVTVLGISATRMLCIEALLGTLALGSRLPDHVEKRSRHS
jgi:hypothetical protein